MFQRIRYHDGCLIVEIDGKDVAKIPESFVLNTLRFNPNVLPAYQRLVMQAKKIIEELGELAVNADGDVAAQNPNRLKVQTRNDAIIWLKQEYEVRSRRRIRS